MNESLNLARPTNKNGNNSIDNYNGDHHKCDNDDNDDNDDNNDNDDDDTNKKK